MDGGEGGFIHRQGWEPRRGESFAFFRSQPSLLHLHILLCTGHRPCPLWGGVQGRFCLCTLFQASLSSSMREVCWLSPSPLFHSRCSIALLTEHLGVQASIYRLANLSTAVGVSNLPPTFSLSTTMQGMTPQPFALDAGCGNEFLRHGLPSTIRHCNCDRLAKEQLLWCGEHATWCFNVLPPVMSRSLSCHWHADCLLCFEAPWSCLAQPQTGMHCSRSTSVCTRNFVCMPRKSVAGLTHDFSVCPGHKLCIIDRQSRVQSRWLCGLPTQHQSHLHDCLKSGGCSLRSLVSCVTVCSQR